ncbi:hypothetical protein [Saccharopolyspora gloriosae]|nr:hypothetical protein [Saccharopolyspora gloriosae]
MLMNQGETALINSPPRRWLQRYYEDVPQAPEPEQVIHRNLRKQRIRDN